jgi:hypothetical protein
MRENQFTSSSFGVLQIEIEWTIIQNAELKGK